MTGKNRPRPSPSPAATPRMVRLSPPFGLCQLFRPIPKDGADRPTLNESLEYGDLTLRFSAREALAAPEQTLLLVLLELAQEQHRRRPREHQLDRSDRTEIGALLWSSLHAGSLDQLADAPATLMLNCSWSELHRRCGSTSTGGAVTESRRASLARLCEVTVWERIEATKTVRSCRLVSWLVGDDQRVHVALNHRLASALLAPGYAQVLLSERLRLGSQTAMLIHAFLSTCLRHGKTITIGYETLVKRLWPCQGSATPASTHRRRLSDVRSALRAIARLDHWAIELGTAMASVTRTMPRMPVVPETPLRASKTAPGTVPPGMPAREMTRTCHFRVPDASYVEHPFWPKPSRGGHLPRNDEAGTTL
ncbi:MAG: replication C family protein [Proteobacteria bacterium]|nr:replication C family protein [Pseudomonadota bacterium]